VTSPTCQAWKRGLLARRLSFALFLVATISATRAQDRAENRSPDLRRPTNGGTSSSGTPTPDRTDGQPPRDNAPDELLAALDQPLDATERTTLEKLTRELGARSIRARELAAAEIRERLGARAAGPLLELSRHERDPERRFRERALVASLIQLRYAAAAHDCGWLGVRWIMSRTDDRFFSVHVVEPLRGEPAALGGIQAEDEIVLWNGTPLEGQDDFIDRVQTAAPRSTVVLTIERPASPTTFRKLVVTVVMGRRPDAPNGAELAWFHRDLATRKLAHWLGVWMLKRRD
jgi:hypothetical protein